MSKLIWVSDTHLRPWNIRAFCDRIRSKSPDGLLITGDISEGFNFESVMEFLATNLNIPVYFNLGNHDFWGSSVAERYFQTRKLCAKYSNLKWLTEEYSPIKLSKSTCLIGSEGWYCGSGGDSSYLKYTLDWMFMYDFRDLNEHQRLDLFFEMAKKSCVDLREKLQLAVDENKNILIATHFPPFSEVERQISHFLKPFYEAYNYNIIMGGLIKEFANKYPNKTFKVFAGHIHSGFTGKITENIKCKVVENYSSKNNLTKIPF
jgi:Icc protein